MEVSFVLELLEQGEKNCEHSGLCETVVYDIVTYDTV